jgi:hypothetical protein
MVPRLIVLWLAASSPAWAEREERYLVKPTTEVSAVEREERYLVKPTTEVSAINATELPLSFAANPLGTDAGDLVSGDSSVHPVSQSFVRFLLDNCRTIYIHKNVCTKTVFKTPMVQKYFSR